MGLQRSGLHQFFVSFPICYGRGRFLTLKKLFNGYQNTLVLGRVKYADI